MIRIFNFSRFTETNRGSSTAKRSGQFSIFNKKTFLILILVVIIFISLLPSDVAFAHTGEPGLWLPGDPIVPCGGYYETNIEGHPNPNNRQPACSPCELLHLAKHIIDFILVAAAPVLATLFFIWGGVLIMLGGENPSMLSSGKKIFKDTLIGLMIVMLAWLITNTIIRTLVDPSKLGGGNWWSLQCEDGTITPTVP